MKNLIAFCGLDCESCEARKATVENDSELRKKVAAEWSKLNGVEITSEMINCDGCRLDGRKTPFCDSLALSDNARSAKKQAPAETARKWKAVENSQ